VGSGGPKARFVSEVLLGQLLKQAADARPVVDVDLGRVVGQHLGVDLILGCGQRRAELGRMLRRWGRGNRDDLGGGEGGLGGCGRSRRSSRGRRGGRRGRVGAGGRHRSRQGRLLVAAIEPLRELQDRKSVV